MKKTIYALVVSILLTTTSFTFASSNNFQFQIKDYHTQRQAGQTLDVNIRYALRDDMDSSKYPDYRELREKAMRYLEPTSDLPVNTYWELIAKAIGDDLMRSYQLAGISVQISVHTNENGTISEPGLHGPIYTIGDINPLANNVIKK